MATNAKQWMVALATAVAASLAGAQAPSLEALERAFWSCDHAATRGALDGGAATQCSVVTETFKARRFGGDFAAMLAWWRANKDAEHLTLAAQDGKRLAGAAHR